MWHRVTGILCAFGISATFAVALGGLHDSSGGKVLARERLSSMAVQRLNADLLNLRHQLVANPGAAFLGFIDNGCEYMTQSKEDAQTNPSTGPNDPRLRPCPYTTEHLGPHWDSMPSPTQMEIYKLQLGAFPPNISLAEANRAMQAALTPAS